MDRGNCNTSTDKGDEKHDEKENKKGPSRLIVVRDGVPQINFGAVEIPEQKTSGPSAQRPAQLCCQPKNCEMKPCEQKTNEICPSSSQQSCPLPSQQTCSLSSQQTCPLSSQQTCPLSSRPVPKIDFSNISMEACALGEEVLSPNSEEKAHSSIIDMFNHTISQPKFPENESESGTMPLNLPEDLLEALSYKFERMTSRDDSAEWSTTDSDIEDEDYTLDMEEYLTEDSAPLLSRVLGPMRQRSSEETMCCIQRPVTSTCNWKKECGFECLEKSDEKAKRNITYDHLFEEKLFIRNPEEFLDNDHSRKMLENLNALKQKINLENSPLCDYLISLDVITQEEKDTIKEVKSEREQIGRLIALLLKKTNRHFDNFTLALIETEQQAVVKNLLTTPTDLTNARQKLARYYQDKFYTIELYSPDDTQIYPQDLGSLYVRPQWKNRKEESDRKQEKYEEEENELFKKMHETASSSSRMIIEGEPGSGKSTFVKNLCNIWAQSVIQKNDPWPDPNDDQFIGRYTILLVITLRHFRFGATIESLLNQQYPFLNPSETYAVLNLFDTQSSTGVFVVLEGYDELRCGTENMILQMVGKRRFEKTHCLTTLRPYSLGSIRRFNPRAVELHFQLCGFYTRESREEYIKNFFKSRRGCEGYDHEMITYNTDTKPEFSEVGKVPIRLEMMCVVWSIFRSLGERVVDIYERFFQCLLHHMEKRKFGDSENAGFTRGEDLMEKYGQLLDDVASLASTWDNCGKPKLLFRESDFNKYDQLTRDDMLEFGCITEDCSNISSEWSFTHYSLQEYLIAYYLANNDNPEELNLFISRCSTINRLEHNISIIKFLCGINSSKANLVIQGIVKHSWPEKQCVQLLDFLLDFVAEFKDESEIEIPLPSYMEFCSQVTTDRRLKRLLLSDKKQKHLKTLKLKYIPEELLIGDLDYVEKLIVYVQEDSFRDTQLTVRDMINLKNVQIHLQKEMSMQEQLEFVRCIPKRNLTELGVSGNNIIGLVSEMLLETPNLTILKIVEAAAPTNEGIGGLCVAVEICTKLKNIYLDITVLNEFVLLLKTNVKVSLTVRHATRNSLNTFASDMNLFDDLHFISLRIDPKNFLHDAGVPLGRLLAQMNSLTVLHVPDCKIRHETLITMGHTLDIMGYAEHLKELDLSGNDIHGDEEPKYCPHTRGCALAFLLNHLPALETLGLQRCRLTPVVVRNLDGMLHETNVKKLYLAHNGELGLNSKQLERTLADFWQHFPELQVLDLNDCGITGPSLLGHQSNYGVFGLVKLRILRLDYNEMSHYSFAGIARYLPRLKELEELSLRCCKFPNADDVLGIVENIPPSLQILDISENNFGCETMKVVCYKEKTKDLKVLCIGSRLDEDMRYVIQKKLRESNPDIYVRYNLDEDDKDRAWDDDIVVQEEDEDEDELEAITLGGILRAIHRHTFFGLFADE